MGVTDLRTDINAEIRLAQTIGKGIGSFVRGRRERREAEEAGERKRISNRMTAAIMAGEGTAREKQKQLDSLPNLVETEMVKRTRERLRDEALLEGNPTQKQLLKDLAAQQKVFEATQVLDLESNRAVTKPGMETLANGARKRIEDILYQISGVDRPQRTHPAGTFDEAGGLENVGRQFVGLDPTQEPVEEQSFLDKLKGGLSELFDGGSIGRGQIEGREAGAHSFMGGAFVPEKKVADGKPQPKPFTNPLTGEPQLRFNLEGKVVAIGGKPLPQPITVKQAKALRAGELDADTALEILREAGGDKDKAREIARDRGFKF
jgi:hypothetical protein